ncbi:hypothetical protein B296_00053713 [Ensete ventricosum]|uniref:Uncharacterized protein n=1 Tax=Ensete ventricosum TaxID=4639 RepID=A0A426Y6Y7_ENSVE|nr:hypothetical protein B296_00053713 [Ensete ventricosum]
MERGPGARSPRRPAFCGAARVVACVGSITYGPVSGAATSQWKRTSSSSNSMAVLETDGRS